MSAGRHLSWEFRRSQTAATAKSDFFNSLLKLDSSLVSLLLNLRPQVLQGNRPVEDEFTTLGVGVEGEVVEMRTSTPRSLATPPTMMPVTCWRPARTHPARPSAFATRWQTRMYPQAHIDCINAHATGTPLGDAAETLAG